MQNSQNQSQLKTLKPKERTYTLHNDAFSAPGNSNLVDVLKMNSDFDIHQLQYAPISNMFTPSSYGLPQYYIPFSNTFQNHTTIAEQLIQNSQPLFLGTLPLKNLAPEGMRIVCEIDIIMLKNYYDLREQIFNKHNQPASKRMDSKSNQVEWIKGRFQYRFRDNISKMFCSMVDEIKSLHNNKTEDGYLNQVEKLNFEPSELFILDKEMKEKNLQNKEYQDPNEIGRRIIKLIDMYIKTSNQ